MQKSKADPHPPSILEEEREEADRHDKLYKEREPDKLRLRPPDWEKFDTMPEALDSYAGAMLRLGDVRGLHVLDAGCGDGWLSTILAKRGARVSGFDISPEGVETARQRAEINAVADRCELLAGSFYSIPFPDQSFDACMGMAILHHLRDKDLAAEQLFRVMKPGTRAIFVEPFGNSRWLERLRLLVPVPSMAPEDPTEWARQIKYIDLRPFASRFEIEYQEFQFFSRLDRVVKSKRIVTAIARFDKRLLRSFPFVRPYARSIVIELRRKPVMDPR